MNSDQIYLDHAATTPVRTEVRQAMRATSERCDFNPSSLHREGRQARAELDDARDRLAAALGAGRTEIVFTSGGTEADNLALFGATRAVGRPAHVVASAIEHHAVTAALGRLADEGIETSLLTVDRQGRVDCGEFERALRPNTVLASIMYANNEVGTVQPIAELADIARRRGVLFHTDAVAVPTWLPIDVRQLGVDMLSISAHKFYGPKGVGALYVRHGVGMAPEIVGGGQESGKRAGTENLTGIVGMAHALELAVGEREGRASAASALRDRLEAGIRERVVGITVNAGETPRLANLCNISFGGVDAAELLIALDLAGISVSAGSACTSGTLEPSHVLAAMAGPATGIRFSLGAATTPAEIERVLAVIPLLVAELRAQAPSPALPGGMGRL